MRRKYFSTLHRKTFKSSKTHISSLKLEWYQFCVFDFSRNAKDFDPFFAKFRENCERNKVPPIAYYLELSLNTEYGHKKLLFSKTQLMKRNIFT